MNLKKTIRKYAYGPLNGVFRFAYQTYICLHHNAFKLKWMLTGVRKPDEQAIQMMRENVTFIYKSFERQKMAKRLYWNIQSYYPGVKVVIADDSREPLALQDEHLEVIQLPFNSGLSYGLNCALSRVQTPYVIRMDDDELLTPYTRFDEQLRFLQKYPQVDLVSVFALSAHEFKGISAAKEAYFAQPMDHAPRKLIIPHLTPIDHSHVVLGKVPNLYIVRTDKLKELGFDDRIRMLDHGEFFHRAAGRLVSVLDLTAYVYHDHDIFDRSYKRYREDIKGDGYYIAEKMRRDWMDSRRPETDEMQ